MSSTTWRFTLALLCLGFVSEAAFAQRSGGPDQRRITLSRMMKPVDVELDEVRMEDFVEFMRDLTNADISPYWETENRPSGLVKDALITIDARNLSALDLMERVLERPGVLSDEFDEATWQMSPSGAFEVGPRSRLNRRQHRVVYDVRDLVFIFQDNQPPQSLDLDSALDGGQGGGGGGGGGGLFGGGGGGGGGDDEINLGGGSEELLEDLIDIIVTEIEPDQWELTTGQGASLRAFRGDLLIRAPDYIHRQIKGYDWWPSSGFSARESPRVSALRRHGADAVAEGNVQIEPAPSVYDEDGVYVRVGPLPEEGQASGADGEPAGASSSSSDGGGDASSPSTETPDSASSSEG